MMYSRRSRSNTGIRVIFGIFTILIAIVAVAVFQFFSSRSSQNGPIPTATTAQSARATPTLIPTGKPAVYRIISDKANLSTSITNLYYSRTQDNWDLTYLGGLAGHLEGTRNMGEGGNFVLAGHVELKDGARGPFAGIGQMKAGDGITIIGDQVPNPVVYQYLVTDVRKVQPQDFGVMRDHGYEELTLITCDDWDQKTTSYQTRVIVHARPVNAVQRITATARANVPATPSRIAPTRVPPSATRRPASGSTTLIPTRAPVTPTKLTATPAKK